MSIEWRAAFRDLGEGVRAQPGRISVAALAIGIGMACLSLLVAALSGLGQRAQSLADELGLQVVAIARDAGESTPDSVPLRAQELSMLRAGFPDSIVAGMTRFEVKSTPDEKPVTLISCSHEIMRTRPWAVAAGRFLDARDDAERSRNVVLSSALADRWRTVVGDVITLAGISLRIVGLLDLGAGAVEHEEAGGAIAVGEDVAFVPSALPPYWSDSAEQPGDALDAVFIRLPEGSHLDGAVERSRRILAGRGGEPVGLSWITPKTLVAGIRRMQQAVRWTAGSVTALCLLLGGTTLMSLMVANVRERVTEIGLRRALGATRADIVTLFVLEASVITATSALLATTLAHAGLWLFGRGLPIPLQIGCKSFLIPLVTAVVLGALFSYWPARVAAQIEPAEALRND